MNKISQYVAEVKAELSKVSWPTREELYGSTVVVLVLCLVLSIFVFGVDYLLNRLLTILF
jgi:preprotein translocase subunit SecE